MEDVGRRERPQGRRGATNHNAALLGTRIAAGVAQAGLAVAHVELAKPEQHGQVAKKATKLRIFDRKNLFLQIPEYTLSRAKNLRLSKKGYKVANI
jgi:hypothetical protein